MLEFSRGRLQETVLQDELIGAFFAGVVSKPLSQKLGITNSEEVVICAMFQSLGRLLVTFFLYEEAHKVRALISGGASEEQAAERVLGISYRELGLGVARHWNFPERLLEGMQCLTSRDMSLLGSEAAKLKIAANLANDLYITALRTSKADRTAALLELSRRYSPAIKMDAKELMAAIDQGLSEIAERATTLNLPVTQSSVLDVIRVWAGGAARTQAEAGAGTSSQDPLMNDVEALDNSNAATSDPHQVLSAGIHDVTETLTSEFALNDVLQMVLETMYRGMGFTPFLAART